MTRQDITRIWLSDNAVNIETADGKSGYELFENYRPLRCATAKEREQYEISSFGIHWKKLDEDLLFDAFCWK